jgi:tetratricopeptide (TPR) repeat protein
MADRDNKITTVTKASLTAKVEKIDIRQCYGHVIDSQNDDEEDPMDKWVMSLNEDTIAKQRKKPELPPMDPHRRPRPERHAGMHPQTHKWWFDRHLKDGNEFLVDGLKMQGANQEQWLKWAIHHYNKADEHYPATVPLLINRCIAYEKLGDLRKAAADAEKALDVEPENVRALYRLARIHRLTDDSIQADVLYKKCFKLSGALEVWKEMTDARLEYLMRTEDCTADEVDQAHFLADSLTQATLFVRAIRKHAADQKEKATLTTPNQIKRQMLLSQRPTADFIIRDLKQQVNSFNSFLTPSNIFHAIGVHLYGCSCRDEVRIRNVLSKECGPISTVHIDDEYVSIIFEVPEGAATALARFAGSLSSGLTEPGKELTVRFSPTIRDMDAMIDICIRECQCLGWRTTGCSLKRQCMFRHLEPDYRADLHPFMRQPESPFLKAAEHQHIKYQRRSRFANKSAQAAAPAPGPGRGTWPPNRLPYK